MIIATNLLMRAPTPWHRAAHCVFADIAAARMRELFYLAMMAAASQCAIYMRWLFRSGLKRQATAMPFIILLARGVIGFFHDKSMRIRRPRQYTRWPRDGTNYHRSMAAPLSAEPPRQKSIMHAHALISAVATHHAAVSGTSRGVDMKLTPCHAHGPDFSPLGRLGKYFNGCSRYQRQDDYRSSRRIV